MYFTKYGITKIAFPSYCILHSSLDSILATKWISDYNLSCHQNSQVTPELFYQHLRNVTAQLGELTFAALRFSSTILWYSFSPAAIILLTVSKVVSLMLQLRKKVVEIHLIKWVKKYQSKTQCQLKTIQCSNLRTRPCKSVIRVRFSSGQFQIRLEWFHDFGVGQAQVSLFYVQVMLKSAVFQVGSWMDQVNISHWDNIDVYKLLAFHCHTYAFQVWFIIGSAQLLVSWVSKPVVLGLGWNHTKVVFKSHKV